MIKFIWDQGFERSYRQRIRTQPAIKAEFFDALDLFAEDPFHPALRTHPLTGPLKGLWAFSCTVDIRVLFKFLHKNEVLLIDIGTHEEVY
jgi:toxin HigB-1